jgi:hypothetical protein
MRVNPIYAVFSTTLVVLLGLVGYLSYTKDAVVAENVQLSINAQKAVVAREALEAALVSTAKRNAATARSGTLATHSLRNSLASSPEWAAQPVPTPVKEALSYDLYAQDSVPADPDGPPSPDELAGL